MRRSHSGPGPEPQRSRLVSPSTKARPAITSIPKGRIQDALEAAASDPVNKTVYVHAGHLSPGGQGPGAHLVQRAARRHHARSGRRRDRSPPPIPTIADAERPSYPGGRQPRRLFRRRRVARRPCCAASRSPARTTSPPAPARSRRSNRTTSARRRSSTPTAAASRSTRGRIRRSSTSRSSATTPAHAAAASRSSISARCRSRCSSATASSATTARRSPARRSTSCTAAAPRIENCLFVGNVANLGVDYVGLLTGGEYHSGARLRRHDRVRGLARDGQPLHVHRQLERRRRRRHRQHLRRLDLLEEHAAGRDLAGARATSSTSPTAPACGARSSTATSTTCAGRSTKDANTFDPPDPRFDAQFVSAGAAICTRSATGL